MLKLLLLFTVLMLPAWAGEPVTDPELLSILNEEDPNPSRHPGIAYLLSLQKTQPTIDNDVYHDCMLKHASQAQTDAAIGAIRAACRHKAHR